MKRLSEFFKSSEKLFYLVKWLKRYAKHNKKNYYRLFFVSNLISTVNLAYPFLLILLVDVALPSSKMSYFINLCMLYFIVFLFEQILHKYEYILWARNYSDFTVEIKEDVIKKFYSLDIGSIRKMKEDELVSFLNYDTEVCYSVFNWTITVFLNGLYSYFLHLCCFMFNSMALGMFMFLVIPIFTILRMKNNINLNDSSKEIWKSDILLSEKLEFLFENMIDLYAINSTKAYEQRLKENFEENYELKQLKLSRIQKKEFEFKTFENLLLFLFFIVSSILIVTSNLSVGKFMSSYILFGSASMVFENVLKLHNTISWTQISIERIQTFLSQYTNLDSSTVVRTMNAVSNQPIIQFDNVDFKYNDEKYILNHCNLEFYLGKSYAIVGDIGSGKSTLLDLILKFNEITFGKIMLYGKDITELTQYQVREEISYVSQEDIILDGTIRENLTLYNKNISDSEMCEACKVAGILNYILHLDKQFETIIGKKGIPLSGGESRRVSIARALLRGKKILLLDEITASLDTEIEKEVLDNILSLKDVLIIIVTHHQSTMERCDYVIEMDNGAAKFKLK